ncbi:hypothetical protein AMR41_09425, partial [Hapalosiphon sp. MRB220]
AYASEGGPGHEQAHENETAGLHVDQPAGRHGAAGRRTDGCTVAHAIASALASALAGTAGSRGRYCHGRGLRR